MSASALDQLTALAPTASQDAPLWAALAATLREIAGDAELDRLVIMTTAQAVRAANLDSVSAFRRWAKKWRVKPAGHDRWPARSIRAGLEREADSVLHKRVAKAAPPLPSRPPDYEPCSGHV